MIRRALFLLGPPGFAGGSVWYFANHRGITPVLNKLPQRNSEQAFLAWLRNDHTRREEFSEFNRFLGEQGVSGIVPNWQLLRTDSKVRRDCDSPAFLLPPRDKWKNVVPALKLMRDHIVPRLGTLEVVSAYRPADLNECIKGARQSRYLSFHALDIVALDQPDKAAMFAELCALREELGPRSRMGLGAYFDPAKPVGNGQFHIDMTGFRTWGFSYGKESSGCRILR